MMNNLQQAWKNNTNTRRAAFRGIVAHLDIMGSQLLGPLEVLNTIECCVMYEGFQGGPPSGPPHVVDFFCSAGFRRRMTWHIPRRCQFWSWTSIHAFFWSFVHFSVWFFLRINVSFIQQTKTLIFCNTIYALLPIFMEIFFISESSVSKNWMHTEKSCRNLIK